ncbi:MAG: Ig-like domain-containing protein [Bacteroidaceae bacterium]|nr:Ig-like domain-containing protein [Bacteroidaceae bacterium]
MKIFTLKSLFLSVLLCAGLSAWAEDEVFYTLTPASGSNNSYAGNCDVEIEGITWNITGNSQQKPWRIGGKSLTNVDRTVYSKTAMESAITKVDLTVGAASSITVNSLKLIVASDANFNNQIDEVSATFTANSTITFTPTSPATEWAEDAYYKFVFNVTVSGNSNNFLEFTKAEFYHTAAEDNRQEAGIYFNPNLPETGEDIELKDKENYLSNTLNNPNNVSPITWSSSDEDVATVSEGIVTVLALGTTTIKATFAGNETYKPATAQYILNVVDNRTAITPSFGENASVNVNVNGSIAAPALTGNTGNATVTYASSNTAIATVNAETGVVTGVAEGTATITATVAETYDYKSGTATFTVNVTDPDKVTYDFSGTNAYGSGIEKTTNSQHYEEDESTWTNGDVMITVNGKYRWWSNDGTLRFYSNTPKSSFTVSVQEGYYITKVVLTGGSNFTTDNGTYSYANSTWTGASTSVKFTYNASSGSINVKTISVYTKPIYTRSVTANNFGTICLPYGVDEDGISGATFYTVASKTVESSVVTGINLEPVTSLTAGVGYIFQATASEISLTPNGTTVDTPVTGGALVGTFEDETAVDDGMYIVSGNLLCETAGGFGYINANRAYIDLTNVPVAEGAAKVRISVAGDDATGIKVIANEVVNDNIIYNLNGQRVVNPTRGLYIQNGQKIMVK